MRLKPAVTVFCLAAVVAWLLVPARAQDRTASTVHLGSMPRVGQAGNSDWPLHNLDLFNRRYSSANEIDPSNASKLTLKWSFDAEGGIGEITPLVVDGVMYFNSGSKLFALDAVTGKSIWIFQTKPDFQGRGRGPTYADGKVFAFGPSSMYSVDAKSGKLLENFGEQGVLRLVNKALEFKYPGKYPADLDPVSIGYSMKAPTAYYDNTLYVGLALGDSHIPGGLLAAVDATTGAIKWVFNTIPQGPQDEGWDIAKDTWGSGARAGGGIWTQPAIDPGLGMIYFNAANPSPDYDGSARKGINLFTDSAIALSLATGKLVWFNQPFLAQAPVEVNVLDVGEVRLVEDLPVQFNIVQRRTPIEGCRGADTEHLLRTLVATVRQHLATVLGPADPVHVQGRTAATFLRHLPNRL